MYDDDPDDEDLVLHPPAPAPAPSARHARTSADRRRDARVTRRAYQAARPDARVAAQRDPFTPAHIYRAPSHANASSNRASPSASSPCMHPGISMYVDGTPSAAIDFDASFMRHTTSREHAIVTTPRAFA